MPLKLVSGTYLISKILLYYGTNLLVKLNSFKIDLEYIMFEMSYLKFYSLLNKINFSSIKIVHP